MKAMHDVTLERGKAPEERTTAAPFISVIVPVRNEAAFIGDTLAQLLAQRYDRRRFEVLVADGRSTDDTRAVVAAWQERHTNLRLLDNPGRLSSAGRNVAVSAARGDIILLVDGHCQLDNPDYLADLAAAFASGADCVGRPQPLDVSGATAVQRAVALARASRLGHHPASHIWSDREGFVPPQSVAVAYRRSVFDAVGLFDEAFDACEDVELNHRVARAGLTCFFTPRVRVRYYPRAHLAGLFRQMVRYGRGRVRLLRKHPDTFSLPGFVPAAFLAGVAAGPLLAWASPLLGWLYLGVLGAYGLTVMLTSLVLAVRARDVRLLPLLPLAFLTIHAGAGVGVWVELLRFSGGSQTRAVLRTAAKRIPDRGQEATPMPTLPFRPRTSAPAVEPPRSAEPILNALTIDVEDYYHVSAFDHCVSRRQWDDFAPRIGDSTWRLLDVLAAAEVRATFFVLGWVAERQPRLVREIRAAGHEVGSHGYGHRLIYEQSPWQFRVDLRLARLALEDALGEAVTAYRAPSFSITQRSLWALDVLIEEGFLFDSSIYPTHHDRYGIPGMPLGPHRIERPGGALWEFPPPVWRCLGYPLPVGGGGYFRLYPYALTRLGLQAINAEGRPFAAYLHPWELDPDQPRLRPGRLRAFRHYVNLHRTEGRLVRLLQDFRFGTLSEALGRVCPQVAARPVPPLAA
jgi:polysaccharide deacetylase family protein (PEP-CTERM system associated)